MNLQTNRYSVVVPTAITDSGVTISVPFYISPTVDQRKLLLNAFRDIKTQQLVDMGYSNTTSSGTLKVVDNSTPPQTPIELELGMDETNLRMAIFSRQGLQERVVFKLQSLTGIEIFSRQEVEETMKLWLDNLYGSQSVPLSNESKATSAASKASTTAKKKRTSAKSSTTASTKEPSTV